MRRVALTVFVMLAASVAQAQLVVPVLNYVTVDGGNYQTVDNLFYSQVCAVGSVAGDAGSFWFAIQPVQASNPVPR